MAPNNKMESNKEPRHPRSHLFMLRLWVETFGNGDDEGEDEVRMQVQHVLIGERRYFRQWACLIQYLQEMLEAEIYHRTEE